MKITRFIKRTVSAVILCALLASVLGCNGNISAEDLMKDIIPSQGNKGQYEGKSSEAVDFSVRLLQNTEESGKNTLISPLSVLSALAMAVNGAEGNTLAEMENTLGVSRDELNGFLSEYLRSLPEGEKYKLNVANSIWVADHFNVSGDFLQKNADNYGADIYKTPFDDSTLKDINNWVERETDGMIKNVLDRIPANVIMYLINALAFDAEWSDIYQENQVRDGEFYPDGGGTQNVEFMHGSENKYITDGNAEGFIKYYAGGKYAFAALLPKEGMSLSDYIDTLSGEKLLNMLSNVQTVRVYNSIPKFESEYQCEMSSILADMGIKDAFDGAAADFSGIGSSSDGNIFINRVIHKTYISVDERGTKAGAVTMIEVNTTGADLVDEVKYVYLDRPFLYMIIDCENNIPVFIGTLNSVK